MNILNNYFTYIPEDHSSRYIGGDGKISLGDYDRDGFIDVLAHGAEFMFLTKNINGSLSTNNYLSNNYAESLGESSLQWGDIRDHQSVQCFDFNRQSLITKTQYSERRTPIVDLLKPLIENYKKTFRIKIKDDTPIFPNKFGEANADGKYSNNASQKLGRILNRVPSIRRDRENAKYLMEIITKNLLMKFRQLWLRSYQTVKLLVGFKEEWSLAQGP